MAESRLWRVRQAIRRLGRLNGCLYVLDRLLIALFRGQVRLHKYYFVAQPIRSERWLPPTRGATLEVRQVMASDAIIREFPRPEAVIPYRFNQHAICLAALKAGKCIGFLWFTLGPYQEDEVRCRYVPLPADRSAWDFDIYLHPEHRNGVAFLKLWDEANSFLAARQIHWSLSRISAFNRNSIFSHLRMGANRIGTATFFSLGSWQVSAATVRPYFHFSMHPQSFPIYILGPGRAPQSELGSNEQTAGLDRR